MEKSREYRKTNPGLGAPKLHAILKKMFDDTGCFPGRDAFIEMLRKHGLMVRIKRRRRYKTTRTPYLAGRRSPQDLSVVPDLGRYFSTRNKLDRNGEVASSYLVLRLLFLLNHTVQSPSLPRLLIDAKAMSKRSSIEVKAKFYRSQSEVLSKTKRSSIEDKAKFYRRPIEHLSKTYRSSIERLLLSVDIPETFHCLAECLDQK